MEIPYFPVLSGLRMRWETGDERILMGDSAIALWPRKSFPTQPHHWLMMDLYKAYIKDICGTA